STEKTVDQPKEDTHAIYKVENRHDYGTKGTKVDILTNHILLAVGNDVPTEKIDKELVPKLDGWWKTAFIFTYHIDFKPQQKGPPRRGKPVPPQELSKPKKYELIEALLDEDEILYKYRDRIAFNGEDTIYSHVPLEEFTLFDGCWEVSNKQKKKVVPGMGAPSNKASLQKKIDPELEEMVSQITLKFSGKVGLKDIYNDTTTQDTEVQESRMSAIDKTCLLSLLGAKFMSTDDLIFQVQGNKFFIFNNFAKAIPFQIGGYLLQGFTVSLTHVYGGVALNTVSVPAPFIKHTKYLPGDPRFKNNEKEQFTLMDWIIECYHQSKAIRDIRYNPKTAPPPSVKDLNYFVEKNTDISALLKGLKVYRPYINYSINKDGTPKPPRKRSSKGIVGFTRESAVSMRFNVLESSLKKNSAPKPNEKPININTIDYFKRKYDITLKYPDMKLVNLGGKNDVVPPECLTIVPGQKLKGQIFDTKTYIDFSAIRPTEKFDLISRLSMPAIKRGLTDSEKEESSAPHNSAYQFMRVPSRILDAPVVQFKESTFEYKDKSYGTKHEESKGNWNMKGHQFISTPAKQVNLRAIFINNANTAPPASMESELDISMDKFASDVKQLGVDFNVSGKPILINQFGPPIKKFQGGGRGGRGGRGSRGGRGGRGAPSGPPTFETSPGEISLLNLLENIPSNTYILYVLRRGNDSAVYDRLKYITDLKFGALNSCVVWDNFKKNSIQYNSNVVMKMNLKLLGSNHSLSIENNKLLIDKESNLPILVLGSDVTHYPEKDQNSIASLVGSYDDKFTQFPGDYMLQDGPGEEIITNVGSLMLNRLKIYQKHNNGKLPTKIMYFRDGVSVDQFSQVVKIEVKSIKESVRKFGPQLNGGNKYDPPVTCIATVKRNQVRFIPIQENAKNEKGEEVAVQSMGNVMPGTVVDRGITSVAHFDFFIQSHQALKGTGVPCHYWCLYDENQSTSDYLQEICNNLCYIFGRSTTSVKVPAPVYYADLLCTRATCFFKAGFELNMAQAPKEKGSKDQPTVSKNVLLPQVNDNIKSVMYYI
uniref:KpAGO n=1 Tax=Vanderwaltozyma polyspora (strain ATCC 22028 / DSM 70294 / BCRC 21397 / CBS 2163 / NBRC 10782 / NRRL Y-8283 / UCD 57-17) TaxID=436907 RepID=UPI0002662B21|nr:Chain A, KpAGO [Vanderwaltozyma polyspora DSM 70294]4F1N_B Chain B, KpAGO [Vanderwaltozyma polyspora DSM 70294]